ncbi:MaoC family dehydratase N-terminal domain-containing protein [Microlunatus sp. Gsoil 973]|uniref:FAS1-like dehydratase domain-containing protein n=1 Tax=Microlunatus sp. Gsoil 973 TaxID=2672569 RepID=UPI0012B4B045|nr:MaoC family dehydratase N-terminal domain-containing protein [Microlunatus sp. Gsoil 973]QGN35005.1 MaoC family dehydratase [Microlunatus sp. Gsoil 973]
MISESHAGRSYPPTEPYEVTRAKIAEFAAALGDGNPAYRGDEPIAPPTFAAVIAGQAWQALWQDADLGLALERIVHGDQRISHARPLRAGDTVTATLTIDKVRVRGSVDMINSSVTLATSTGEVVCTASSTFLHTREQA